MTEEQKQASAKPSELNALLGALRAGKQADADGAMVIVSRQACQEAAARIEAMRKVLADLTELSIWVPGKADFLELCALRAAAEECAH